MPLRFVNAGEGLERYDAARGRADERAWQHATRERVMREDAEKQSVDAALREAAGGELSGLSRVEAAGGEASTPQRQSWRAPVIQRLAKTPGGGAQAVTLLQGEEKSQAEQRTATRAESREDRELAHRGLEQFNKAMDNGDLDTARVVNQRFRLGIPEQAFANQRVLARLRGIASTLHRSGIRGETAAEVFKAALTNPDVPIEQAIQSGMNAGAGRADKGDLIETDKGWFNLRTKQYEKGPDDTTLMPTQRRLTHPPRAPARGPAGTGPRVHKVQELANGTIRLVMSDGTGRILTDALGNPERGPGAARRAAQLVGKLVSPIQTREERSAAVREGVRISDEIGGAKPPATRLKFDAQGNPVD